MRDDLTRPINRRITKGEYDRALDYAISKGFENVFIQQRNSADLAYTPDFDAYVIFDPINRAYNLQNKCKYERIINFSNICLKKIAKRNI